MGRNLLALTFPLLLAAGCAAPRPAAPAAPAQPAWAFPADARITQRAILTARGRQFALNGFLARSAHGGSRLIVTENFGQVLADVLVKPDGRVFVLRSSRMLRPAWVRRYVSADLQAVFGSPPPPDPAVRMLDPAHFAIQRRWYALDLRILETQPGPQPDDSFDETRAPPP
jgi:hypothetical protein